MDFIEYIEKVCDIKLKDYQKEFLRKYDQAKNEGKTLIINPARASRSSYLYLVGLYETAMNITTNTFCMKLYKGG